MHVVLANLFEIGHTLIFEKRGGCILQYILVLAKMFCKQYKEYVGIQLPAIQLPETSSYPTFSSSLTEWSNNP